MELTIKEFDLLELLMREPGVTIKRERIMSEVWDSNWWGSTRTLDTHTSTLRRKIIDDTDPPSKIVTVPRRRLPLRAVSETPMRRRLVLSTVAVVTVVILVLLVPVLLIVRNAAESALQSRLDQQLGSDHRRARRRPRGGRLHRTRPRRRSRRRG